MRPYDSGQWQMHQRLAMSIYAASGQRKTCDIGQSADCKGAKSKNLRTKQKYYRRIGITTITKIKIMTPAQYFETVPPTVDMTIRSELFHTNEFNFAVAVILSAQATDIEGYSLAISVQKA